MLQENQIEKQWNEGTQYLEYLEDVIMMFNILVIYRLIAEQLKIIASFIFSPYPQLWIPCPVFLPLELY